MGYGVLKAENKWPDGKINYYCTMTNPGNGLKEPHEAARMVYQSILYCMYEWQVAVNSDGIMHIEFVDQANPLNSAREINLTQLSGASTAGSVGRSTSVSPFTLGVGREKYDQLASIPHEIGHLIGLAHENERNGMRKAYPWDETKSKIPMLCIKDDADPFFFKPVVDANGTTYSDYGTNFDIQSIMHYIAVSMWAWNFSTPNDSEMIARQDTIRTNFTLNKSGKSSRANVSRRGSGGGGGLSAQNAKVSQSKANVLDAELAQSNIKAMALCMNGGVPLNRPTPEEVLVVQDSSGWSPMSKKRWKPSDGDIAMVRLIYPGPQLAQQKQQAQQDQQPKDQKK